MELPLLERCLQITGRYYCCSWFLCDGMKWIREHDSNTIHKVWLHIYLYPIHELKLYALGWSMQIHRLIRMGTIVFGGSLGWQPPAEMLFKTTCDEIVYFNNFLLSVIIGPQNFLLLTMTLTFKERYIFTPSFLNQSNNNWLNISETKDSVSIICDFDVKVYLLWPFRWSRAYLLWPCCWRNKSFHMP